MSPVFNSYRGTGGGSEEVGDRREEITSHWLRVKFQVVKENTVVQSTSVLT